VWAAQMARRDRVAREAEEVARLREELTIARAQLEVRTPKLCSKVKRSGPRGEPVARVDEGDPWCFS
jgi:hypothetical protein